MDKNEQANIPLRPFMAVTMAPVVVFALANLFFLPVVASMINFDDSFLNDLLVAHPINNPYIVDLIFIILGYLCLPFSVIAVLVGPPLTSFLVNLKYPAFTNKSRAILGGGVFLSFHALLLIVLLIFRFMGNLPSIYSSYLFLSSMKPSFFTPFMFLRFLDPLPCLLSFTGIALSCSIAIAGRFGAKKGSHNAKSG